MGWCAHCVTITTWSTFMVFASSNFQCIICPFYMYEKAPWYRINLSGNVYSTQDTYFEMLLVGLL
jgi:hypothetical protein